MSRPSSFAQAFAEASGTRQAFRVAIVAAVHIQPSIEWIGALSYAAKSATVIIVDDSDGKLSLPENWDVYDYARQKEVLGEDMYRKFEMFQKSAACKTFGLWLAHQRGFDPIIVIDSDCVIPPDFVGKHIEALLKDANGWDNPLEGTGFYSRGFPYFERHKPVWAHMGLWENELDLYGTDRVGKEHIPKQPPIAEQVSTGGFFPLSGMNVSFRNDAAPYMMFLPNFLHGEHRFTRHDDIWGGYIFQKVAKAKGFALTYGSPLVFHDTVVIPEDDAAEEVAMIKFEKDFYHFVDDAFEHSMSWRHAHDARATDVYEVLADFLESHPNSAFENLIPALDFASELFALEEQDEV